MFFKSYRFENPNFDRLDAENAQFRREHRIPHAKLCIYRQLERSEFCDLSDFWRKLMF